jgi:hypothetical protein
MKNLVIENISKVAGIIFLFLITSIPANLKAEREKNRALSICVSERGRILAKLHCKKNERQVTIRADQSNFQTIGVETGGGSTGGGSNTGGGSIGISSGNSGFSPNRATPASTRTISPFPTTGSTGTPVSGTPVAGTPTPSSDDTTANFPFNGCYTKDVTVASSTSLTKSITLNCDDSGSEFMTGRGARPERSTTDGAIALQFEENITDNGVPVGTLIQFTRTDNTLSTWGISGAISCCRRNS